MIFECLSPSPSVNPTCLESTLVGLPEFELYLNSEDPLNLIECGHVLDAGLGEGEVTFFTYVIKNIGNVPLEVANITLPAGNYFVQTQPPAEIAVGESGTFVIGHMADGLGGENTAEFNIAIDGLPACPQTIIVESAAVVFEQYDGDFVYPAWAYTDGLRYFTSESIDGETTQKNSPIGTDPTLGDCYYLAPLGGLGGQINGIINIVWSGSHVYNSGGVGAGTLNAFMTRQGFIGAYDAPGDPGKEYSLSATNFNALLQQIIAFRGKYGAAIVTEVSDDDSFARILSTPDDPKGFFPGSFGGPQNNIYCKGSGFTHLYFGLITPEYLLIPIARTGDPARTQEILTFDTGTRTMTGTKSRARFTITPEVGKTSVTGEYLFRVTPSVGDPYDLYMVRDYAITGSPQEIVLNYPEIVGATVRLEDWRFVYFPLVFDDFETYDVEDYIQLDPIDTWGYPATFLWSFPNQDSWDKFEEYEEGQIEAVFLGYAWPAPAVFYTIDPSEVVDDFETYAEGTIVTLSQGIGWAQAGGFMIVIRDEALDDFESYPTGPIAALTFAAFDNLWVANGSLTLYVYDYAYEDFEAYATGAITVFNDSPEDSLWAADGGLI